AASSPADTSDSAENAIAEETPAPATAEPAPSVPVEEPAAVEPPAEAPPAEEPVAKPEVPAVAAAEPPAAPVAAKGLTPDGRAANDPRVAPKAVGEVAITTDHLQLFREEQLPPVAASGNIAPRASNDPRGPRAGANAGGASES
ncbi:MAG TPA: hypothetical protein DD459_15715, partial [Halieaceae bacterium]|nr:hypothetical protein [Halieaceae bacterium]